MPVGTHKHQRDQHQVGRAPQGAVDAGQLRLARIAGGEEDAVEAGLQPAVGLELVEEAQRLVAQPAVGFGQVAVDRTLGVLVDLVVGDQPHFLALADQGWVGLDHLAELRGSTGADEPAQHAAVLAALGIREQALETVGDQSGEVGLSDDGRVARALRIDRLPGRR